jgi:hypothetical protein
MEQSFPGLSFSGQTGKFLYCRPPGFTVVSSGKHLAGGLQSGCTANLTGMQYNLQIGYINMAPFMAE